MTTVERLLTELTPLPVDVIRYCIQPYLTRPVQWKNTFEYVLVDVRMIGFFVLDRNIRPLIRWILRIFNDNRRTDIDEMMEIFVMGNIDMSCLTDV